MAESEFPGALPWIPARLSLAALAESVQQCHGCDLYRNATQAVPGEGPKHAAVMMVGEQPGDVEDRTGHPFVGPAGKLLDRALADAHVDRARVYVTNAVKHFKFEPRGKRRIHGKPNAREVAACRPWLDAEIRVVKPQLIVCLGATAAQDLMGRAFRLTQHRGEFFPHDVAEWVMATVHPSALLRMPDEERRHAEYELFVRDLARIPERVAQARMA
ncbi:MAG TPA: UdgX family uracil-DNA binding protein [Bryobacteraceae bacterium]|nr:UdgX family uracil-DNA binding protein [Bryobacteraceae bacterium]